MTATAVASRSPVSAGEQRRLLLGAYLSMVGLAACTSPLAVCLTAFSCSFPELTTTGLGLLSTTSLLSVVAGILGSGPLADRWGLRPFMILGAVLEITGLLVISQAPVVGVLLLGISLVGIGTGIMDGLASPLVAELRPENKTQSLNWLHACYPIGFLLMGFIAAWLLRATDNWRLVFPAITAPTLGALVLFALTRFPRHQAHGEGLATFRRVIGKRLLWVALAGILLAGATEMGVEHWAPTYTERVLGYPRETGAAVLLGFAAGMMVGRLGVGALGRHMRPLTLLLLGALASLAATLGVATGGPGLAMGSMVALGLAVSSMWPTLMAYAADRVPGGGATLYTLLSAAGNVGAAGSPLFIGVVAETQGLRGGVLAAVVFPAAAVVLLAWRLGVERPAGRSRT